MAPSDNTTANLSPGNGSGVALCSEEADGIALQLTLDPEGQAAFDRLAGGLPLLAKEAHRVAPLLDDLAKTFVLDGEISRAPGYTLGDAERDLAIVAKQIKSAEFVEVLQDFLLRFRKADLSTGGLAAGGALQPAQGVDEEQRESVGMFMRVPPPFSEKFAAKRGEDKSPPHATLLQAGDLTADEFDKFLISAREVLKGVSPFMVEMTDFGEFKSTTGMRIPHMIPRTKGTDMTFEGLHMKLCEKAQEDGFTGCKRQDPFKPHVTLDYLKEDEEFEGEKPEGEFMLTEIEVWGAPGGKLGRVVIELGTGKILREVASNKNGSDSKDAEFKILSKADSEEERTVFGIVLEPETIDSQNDIYSEDEIRKTAYRFMERYQQFGLMHDRIISSILPLECYLAPVDFEINGQSVKKGTWLLRVRVLDDEIWRKVKSGELTGFSIGGSAMRTPDTVEVAA